MSFSSDIKKEIANKELKDCCKKAQLSALVQMFGRISIKNNEIILKLVSENPVATRRLKILLKEVLSIKTNQLMFQKANLKKNMIYENETTVSAMFIYEQLGLYTSNRGFLDYPGYQIIQKDCCAKAYLAGIFLAFGACNRPESTSYHLELSTEKKSLAEFIIKLISRFNIDAKLMLRRNKYVVYIKKSDQISDFLILIGAYDAMLKFEDLRMKRDIAHNISRINNCDIANEVRSLKKANEQLDDIEQLLLYYDLKQLDDKIIKVIELRRIYPEYSLKELTQAYNLRYKENISKSGLRHRFNKIKEMIRRYKDE